MRAESYQLAYDKARLELELRAPHDVVARTESRFEDSGEGKGRFLLPYFGEAYSVAYPDGLVSDLRTGQEPPISTTIVILHYLITADGSPLAGQWLNFRKLPGGLMYLSAFEAQCCAPLAREFGRDLSRFLQSAEAAGGARTRLGDASFLFRVFPRFPVICVLWLGDDELSPAVDFLFDEAAPHYLHTEDIAVACRDLGRRLMQ